MLLESLLKLVETLRDRIDEHGDVLRQSEALTRYALIDPLLRELGWDTADPALVIPEFQSGNGRADYALLSNGSPAMMVEAKKLGDDLRDRARTQGIQYCIEKGTKHFAVTDGQRWEIYETHRPVPIDEKRVVAFDLKSQSPAAECLKALALWRPSVEEGYVGAGNAPVVSSPPEVNASPIPDPIPRNIPEANVSASPASSQVAGGEWSPLSDWNPGQGDPMPVRIMFPDKSLDQINNGYDVAVKPTSWLIGRGLLSARDCPITNHAGRRILVTDDPDQLTDKPADKKEVGGGLYIGTQYNGHIHVRNARTIIERVGQAPAQFKVRFS